MLCVQDVRDHLNELAELATRASGFMGTGFAAEAWTKTGHRLWQLDEMYLYPLYPPLLRYIILRVTKVFVDACWSC